MSTIDWIDFAILWLILCIGVVCWFYKPAHPVDDDFNSINEVQKKAMKGTKSYHKKYHN